MTKARFQADADLRQAIVTGVIRRQPSLDFQSANEAGLQGLKDPEVLAFAARDGRVLVTHDRFYHADRVWSVHLVASQFWGSDCFSKSPDQRSD